MTDVKPLSPPKKYDPLIQNKKKKYWLHGCTLNILISNKWETDKDIAKNLTVDGLDYEER